MHAPSPLLATARASALNLRERLACAPPAAGDRADEAGGDALLRRWRELLDREGSERFERRLRWDGLDEATVRAALAPDVGHRAVDAAEWTQLWAEACAAAELDLTDDPSLDGAAPLPFEEVLLPLVHAGRARLRAAAPALDDVLAPVARGALERALLSELSSVAEQALFVDFSVHRARRGNGGFTLGGPSRVAYLDFVRRLREARLEPILERYPVLARLLAVRVSLWVESSAELVARTRADAPALAETFATELPGRIVELHTGRGDTHRGGRAVARVRFESGLQLMYKPRSLTVDLAFYALLEWLHARGLEPGHRVLAILARGEYGWVEFVQARPLDGHDALREYHERAGALLCLSYLLGAGDLHSDNLIAAGAYPVPVDLEMIMLAPVSASAEVAEARPPGAITVLSSLLLPYWNVGQNGATVFRAGGMGIEDAELRSVHRVWRAVNTDRMARTTRVEGASRPDNVPVLDGRRVPPTEGVDDIVRGFERCHAFLEAHRAELIAASGPLVRFRGQRTRVLLRDTRIYGNTMRGSLHPGALKSGVLRSLELEVLRVSVLTGTEPAAYWPAFEAEQRDLEELDFPLFWGFTDGTVLHDSRNRPVGTFCAVSAYDQTVERLRRLDAADREHQKDLIRFIYTYAEAPRATVDGAEPGGDGADTAPLDATAALAEAGAIARALEAMVLRDADGSANWVGADRSENYSRLMLRRLGDRLHDGRAGVALFLAALDAVGGTGHAALAADALAPLRRTLRSPGTRTTWAAELDIGTGLGIGGIVYTLAGIGRLTGDDAWIDDARLAANTLTPRRIADDPELEVLRGTAGAALALLSLHGITGERWLLERAEACGRRLLAAATPEPVTGYRAWRLKDGHFGTGFAHGAGGIATALLAVASASGNESFAAAAEEGFRFEDAIPEVERVDTTHLATAAAKASTGSPWKLSWCNGPVGVALGRAVYGGTVPAAVLEAAADLGVAGASDHPCCGTLGRVELLLAAGEGARAREIAGRVVARARNEGSYQIARDVPEARNAPAFFQGLSGIGYTLLRVAHPARLPSVLAFR